MWYNEHMKSTDIALLGIYEIEMRHIIARTGILAEHLGWTKQKTCRILNELEASSMIHREKLAFFTVSKNGRRRAEHIICAMRNLETILCNAGIDKENCGKYVEAMISELSAKDAKTLSNWCRRRDSNPQYGVNQTGS